MLGVVIGVLLVLLSLAVYIKSRRAEQREEVERAVPRGRGGLARMRRGVAAHGEEDEEDLDDDGAAALLEEAGVKLPEGKIGKKKMEKLQQKAERRLAREAEEREREERREVRAKEQEEADAQREKDRQEELAAEEEAEARREALRLKEEEEYRRLREGFAVDAEGFDEEEEGGENQLSTFIQYIKDTKMVLLEDLAAHFKMRATDTIDRVVRLQEEGLLSGVIDDRGKFIYVSQEELQEVAKFIRQRGRVSIAEIAENSHKLIRMNPVATQS